MFEDASDGGQSGGPVPPTTQPPPTTPQQPAVAQPLSPPGQAAYMPPQSLGPQPPPTTPQHPSKPSTGFAGLNNDAGASISPPGTFEQPDQAVSDMFKRETLSATQKLIMLFVVLIVVGLLVGGGIWLYLSLDPFSNGTTTTTTEENIKEEQKDEEAVIEENTTEETPVSEDDTTTDVTNVPLHERDTDGDGLRDIDEKKYGTDENVPDTDGDGITDYDEVKTHKTDPLKVDTDGDGHEDGSEINNGYDPNNSAG
ncbi:MAG: hypothetical protein Q8P90_06005 [bacterium]|nr:hypothetical protein [bacterium]